MEEPIPAPDDKKRLQVDSYLATLIVFTVALVFAWVFYFFYIYQSQEITFTVDIRTRGGVTEQLEEVEEAQPTNSDSDVDDL
ncbi:MAG: hypothetical protein Q8Q20_05100 [bacterium]|nr:hypothetical protein [bacterium]